MLIWNNRNKPDQGHSVTSQKTGIFNNTLVRISNAEFQLTKYRVIQEERSIFFGGENIGHCEKKKFLLTYRLYFVKKGGNPQNISFVEEAIKTEF